MSCLGPLLSDAPEDGGLPPAPAPAAEELLPETLGCWAEPPLPDEAEVEAELLLPETTEFEAGPLLLEPTGFEAELLLPEAGDGAEELRLFETAEVDAEADDMQMQAVALEMHCIDGGHEPAQTRTDGLVWMKQSCMIVRLNNMRLKQDADCKTASDDTEVILCQPHRIVGPGT